MKTWRSTTLIAALCFPSLSLALTETELVNSVKHTYPQLLKERANIEQSLQKERAAFGAFDPAINGYARFIPEGGYESRYGETMLDMPIEDSSMKVFSGYRIGRGDWPIYEQKSLTNEYGEVKAGIRYSLIRNNRIDIPRANLYKARINVEVAKANLDYQYLTILRDAKAVYWQWQGSLRKVKIATLQLSIAETRRGAIKKAVDLGDRAHIDLVENDRLIMQRKGMLVKARQDEFKFRNQLSLYYRDKTGQPKTIAANTTPKPMPVKKAGLMLTDVKAILRYQPQLKLLDHLMDKEKVNIKLYENNRQAKLDVALYYEKQFGEGNPLLQKSSANIGLTYQIPLLNRKANGQRAAAIQRVKGYRYEQQLIADKLNVFLKNTLNTQRLIYQAHELQEKELDYAKQLEAAESSRFDSGDSSLFLVNQREQVVALTQIRLVDLAVGYKLTENDISFSCAYNTHCIQILKHSQ